MKRYLPPTIRIANMEVELTWAKSEIETASQFKDLAKASFECATVAISCNHPGLAKSYARTAAQLGQVAIDYLEKAEQRMGK